MDDENQADPPERWLPPEFEVQSEAEEPPADEPPGRRTPTVALAVWLLLLFVCGVGGIALQLQELAALVALAGLFIAAQAADVDPQWFLLNRVLSVVVPVGGCASFAMLAVFVYQGEGTPALRFAGSAFCAAAALFAILTAWPAVARRLTRLLFRASGDSFTLQLAARLVALTLLVSIPGVLVFERLMDPLLQTPGMLTGSRALGGELLGYLLLALAGVGFLVRRDALQTLERLGIRRVPPRDLGLVVLGAAALFALNSGTEWIQKMVFPALWAHDRHVNEALVMGLSTSQAMLLGVTAGVGEELTMRGALQPRLGLWLTSALFAALHVQYSWFGMLVVMLIGAVLGLLRQRSGTTVCIAVHALYDVVAVLTT
ncbi:MAG: CPBP family intramembrane glutamic endopeptidase [Candidatus Eiseniibacteriota bacterium]